MGIFKNISTAFTNFITYFGNDDLFGERVDEMKEIQGRRDYREGKQRDMLKVKFNKPNDNVKRNIIGKAINQSRHLLLGQGVDFDLPGDEESPEQLWIDACWAANKKNIFLKKLFLNAADGRCGFIKLNPTATVKGSLNGTEMEFPKLENIDPLYMEMDTLPHDIDIVIRYTIKYLVEIGGHKKIFKQEIEHQSYELDENGNPIGEGNYWLITDYYKDLDSGTSWEMADQVRWDYPFAPILHFQNLPKPNDVWGNPDASDDMIELQDKLNFNLSNINKTIRYMGHPQTIGKGIGKGTEFDRSPDGMWLLPSADADVFNLEMQSDLAGASNHLDYLGRSILDGMDAVNVSNMKDRMGQLTNFGLRVLFYDALGKMNDKKDIWDEMLKELNRRLLILNGMNPDPGEVVWPESVLPVDQAEISNLNKADLEMGLVSKQTIAKKRGYDYKEEQERMNADVEDIGSVILRNFETGRNQ